MSSPNPEDPHDNTPQQTVGGAIIDEAGREIPITEQMVQHAFSELDEASISAPHYQPGE